MPASNTLAHRRVRVVGIAIIVTGCLAAALVWASADGGQDGDGMDDLAHQREAQALSRLGGQASVETAELDRWLSSLWHGRRLAGTLLVLSLLAGGSCLWIGGLMAEDVDQ